MIRNNKMIRSNKIKTSGKWFDVLNIILLILFSFATLYPFWNIAVISVNNSVDSIRGGVYFWPREFTLYNYSFIFSSSNLITASVNSVLRTIIGTISSVFCTMMLAYTLSRKDFVFRKHILFLFVMTMYFSGGIIPSYMLTRNLGLIGKFSVYIIPGLLSAFNLIVAKSFIEEIPASLIEAATIDGAGDFKIFISVILPLSMPVLATIALFNAVGHWNDWFTTFLYTASRPNLSVLQYELMKILQTANTSASNASSAGSEMFRLKNSNNIVTPGSLRAAMTIVATVPILIVYPFLQKYFVQGFSVGAVKE